MINKEQIIENILNNIYPNPKNNLHYINEYTLLIAILLSSQCKEIQVNIITRKLFKIIKSPYDITKLSIYEIRKCIKPLGIYKKKSKNIFNLSYKLINEYNGKIPKNIKELETLPGIGHKSASVFLSFTSNYIYVFPVDTHIHRMMKRWGYIYNHDNVKKSEYIAKSIFKKENWKKLHLQIICYGREYSPAKKWIIDKDIIYKELIKNNFIKKVNHQNHQKTKKKK